MNILGYHGTVEKPEKIIEKGKLNQKRINFQSLPGDLGTGTYFFKEDPNLARCFIEKRYDSGKVNIIMCKINVEENEILNFNNPGLLKAFNQFKEATLKNVKKTFKHLKGNRNCIDGIVINLMVQTILKREQKNIKLVIRDTYTETNEYSYEKEGRKRFFISNFPNGTELCVRDHTIVEEGVYCDEL